MLCPNQGVNICSTPALCQRDRVIQLRDSHLLLRKKELNKRILMRETCPSFRELIRREGKAPTPLPAHTLPPPVIQVRRAGACWTPPGAEHFRSAFPISWLVVLVFRCLPSIPPLCSGTQGGFLKSWIQGGAGRTPGCGRGPAGRLEV